MNDLISIIVPVYKVEKYLRRCIDSLLNQSYTNLEIILVDDGSPDNSGAICDEYSQKDSRVKVIHKENSGVSAARNSGIKKAKGKYITFVDSDDYVEKDYIKVLYDLFDKDTDITICSAMYIKDENKINEDCENPSIRTYNNIELCFNIKEFEKGGVGSVCWGKLYRKKMLNNISFKEGMINEDEVFLHEIFYVTRKAKFVSKKLYNYCIYNTDSIMRSNYTIKRLDSIKAFELRLDFYKDKNKELYDHTIINYLSVIGINYFLTKKNISDSRPILKKLRKKINENYNYARKINCSFVWKIRLLFVRISPYLYGYFMYVLKKRGGNK